MTKNVLTIVLLLFAVSSFSQTRELTLKLRGVYDAEISLIPFNGVGYNTPLKKYNGVKNGEQVRFSVSDSLLSRFKYRAKAEDHLSPTELQLFLDKEDIPCTCGDMVKPVGFEDFARAVKTLGIFRPLINQPPGNK